MELIPAYPIRTERLLLRPIVESDAADLAAYRGIPEVCRYVPFSPMSVDDVLARMPTVFAQTTLTEPGQALTVGAELDGRIVGDLVLFFHSELHRSGELGYVFHPGIGGHGYAAEAAAALVDLAFATLGLHRLVARVDARNDASAALVRRLGFRQEAHLIQNEWFKGEWSDELVFAILEQEWTQSEAR